MTPGEVITHIRQHGGEIVDVDGRWVIRNAKRVPSEVIAELRLHASEVKATVAALHRPQASTQAEPPLQIARRKASAREFLDAQERAFLALCAEFGVVPKSLPAKRRVA